MPDPNVEPRLHRRWRTPCFDKLSGLGWSCGFAVSHFGVRLAVRSDDPALLEQLRALVPAGARPYRGKVVDHYFSAIQGEKPKDSGARESRLLYHNHTELYVGADIERLLDTFAAHFQLGIAALAPRHTFIHAGVVGWKGYAILLPGRTLSGKTTLTAELVRAGASYFSDEYAVLDDKGRVHPYLKPLAVRAHPGARQIDVPVEKLGGKPARRPLPPGLVVMSRYKQGAQWRPRRLTPGRGALAMLDNAVNARHVPERVIADIHRVVAQAPVVKSSRGEAAEAAASILRMLERQCRPNDPERPRSHAPRVR